ncbi:hypothetical protein [Gottfriedia acidiceleris]|uniref:hypothetical protein n=1 Tax=Gottfriedia acidiceleris TaxID=371036 RepID=UPI00101C1AB7|nr:hypothetical protein [Gottfriedia acidiceleris]
MKELETVYVIETSEDLYVVEDDIFDEKVLDGVLELATRFYSYEDAEEFLKEMQKTGNEGKMRAAKIFIEVIKE